MPVGHFEESDIKTPSQIGSVITEGVQHETLLGLLLTDYTSEIDENGNGIYEIPFAGEADDLTTPPNDDCGVNNCQKIDFTLLPLKRKLQIDTCVEMKRTFKKSGFAKDEIMSQVFNKIKKKNNQDLLAEIVLNIAPSNTFDGTTDLMNAIYKAENHLFDAGLDHSQSKSFLIGTGDLKVALQNLKSFGACCGEFVNPIKDIVGAVANFSYIQVPTGLVPSGTAYVVNKGSGAFGIWETVMTELAMTDAKCTKYQMLQYYGVKIFGDKYVAKINYTPAI